MGTFSEGYYAGAKRLKLKHGGKPYTPTAIAVHYTVTDTLKAAKTALDGRNLSYTFLVDRDGSIHQTRPVTEHAAHAGRSNWKEDRISSNAASLNRKSVSLSFISRGFFAHSSGEHAYDVNPHQEIIGATYPLAEAQKFPCPYDPGWRPLWHVYDPRQLKAAKNLIRDLKAAYPGLTDLYGHDDISIGGKSDPGPLCPLQAWRQEFDLLGGLGFKTTIQSPDGVAELRRGPSGRHASRGQIANGATVHIRGFAYTYSKARALVVDKPRQRYLTGWASVDVTGSNRHDGFIYGSLFASTPLTGSLAEAL